jgi:hypothetical protein
MPEIFEKNWPTTPQNGWRLQRLVVNFDAEQVKEVWVKEGDEKAMKATKATKATKARKADKDKKAKKAKKAMKAMKAMKAAKAKRRR